MKKSSKIKFIRPGDLAVVKHETGLHPFGVQVVRVSEVGCRRFLTGNGVLIPLTDIVGVINPAMDSWAVTEIPETYIADKTGGCHVSMEDQEAAEREERGEE